MSPADLVRSIRPGDRVTVINHDGELATGRAVSCSSTHVALDLTDERGYAAIVDPSNIVDVKYKDRD